MTSSRRRGGARKWGALRCVLKTEFWEGRAFQSPGQGSGGTKGTSRFGGDVLSGRSLLTLEHSNLLIDPSSAWVADWSHMLERGF